MLGKISGINGVLVSAVLLHALAMPTPAQFVPGHIFSSFRSSQCNVGTDYVMEINPETGESFFFASVPVCGGLKGMAMSPDGKRLRVTSYNSGTVFEFDSQGNWTVVPGVSAPAGWNNIAYDQQGNFYASNPFSDAKVVRIPPEGGPPEVLAYADNNGVALDWPGAIAAGPSGEVYVADDDRLIRIGPDGGVTLFDQYPMYSFIYAVLVDDFGFVYAKVGGLYRYAPGDTTSRVLLRPCSQATAPEVCSTYTLSFSPDRSKIFGQSYDENIGPNGSPIVISIDPDNGSVETVTAGFVSWNGMSVVPLRADVDGDRDSDLIDMEWLIACSEGPQEGIAPTCDLADMDADGDIDLFDMRFFLLGHTALQN